MKITKDDVVSLYVNEGKTSKEISEIAGVTPRYILSVLKENGVVLTEKRRTNGHKVNVDFFKTWSPEMSYVLGFVLTDGCISKNTLTIAQKSPEILEEIKVAMGTDAPVTKRKNGKSFIHTLIINRKEIVKDLANLGITPNKSRSVGFPTVPNEHLPHFIRGVIDGDGWVQDRGYVLNVTSGSKAFADQLKQILVERNFNSRVSEESNIYRIWVSGKNDVLRMGKWLYEDSRNLFLQRKRDRFFRHAS